MLEEFSSVCQVRNALIIAMAIFLVSPVRCMDAKDESDADFQSLLDASYVAPEEQSTELFWSDTDAPPDFDSSLSLESKPPETSYPIVNLGGLFQADVGWFVQDAANIVAVGDIQDGADFRRARLAASGSVADNVSYIVEFDFGFPGRPSFMDVWLEVRDLPRLQNIRIGQYRQPLGIDGMTVSRI